ncbi:MAG: DUF4340 domain-containing protein [Gammaproteobacteria bacterium]|nr:DUF4340 domain-containing protein [Gammaproteobacteria bacterium]
MRISARSLLNLGLLGLAAALAVLVYWEPGVEAPEDLPRLTALTSADVEHVVIRPQRGGEIRLDRDQGVWMMRAPVVAYANEFRIDALLGVTRAASHAQFETGALDLAKFNLDPPASMLRLNDVELAFGDSEPLDNRRYVRNGSTVHLINDEYFYFLQAGFTAFVSNRLLPPSGKPAQIRLPQASVSRSGEHWTLTPAQEQPSADAFNEFVDAWRAAQAVQVDRYAGEESRGAITVSFEDGAAPLEFLLLETDPELVLARADLGLRYHLTPEQAQRLLSVPAQASAATAE